MNIRSIRRILALLTLTVTATAGLVARADAPPPLAPVFINGPADGATVSYATLFDWTDTGANKYFLKFTIVETGETFKHALNGISCGIPDCEVAYENTPLYDAVADGQTVTWRVVAKYGASKVKSAPRTLTANTVVEPSILLPSHNAQFQSGDLLSWDTAIANDRYTVIVKRLSTSELVAKYHILDSACAVTCSFDPEILTDLVPGAPYRWFVKARGLNGDTAKSAKQNFVVPFGISD